MSKKRTEGKLNPTLLSVPNWNRGIKSLNSIGGCWMIYIWRRDTSVTSSLKCLSRSWMFWCVISHPSDQWCCSSLVDANGVQQLLRCHQPNGWTCLYYRSILPTHVHCNMRLQKVIHDIVWGELLAAGECPMIRTVVACKRSDQGDHCRCSYLI